jgi:hypothetical protein
MHNFISCEPKRGGSHAGWTAGCLFQAPQVGKTTAANLFNMKNALSDVSSSFRRIADLDGTTPSCPGEMKPIDSLMYEIVEIRTICACASGC